MQRDGNGGLRVGIPVRQGWAQPGDRGDRRLGLRCVRLGKIKHAFPREQRTLEFTLLLESRRQFDQVGCPTWSAIRVIPQCQRAAQIAKLDLRHRRGRRFRRGFHHRRRDGNRVRRLIRAWQRGLHPDPQILQRGSRRRRHEIHLPRISPPDPAGDGQDEQDHKRDGHAHGGKLQRSPAAGKRKTKHPVRCPDGALVEKSESPDQLALFTSNARLPTRSRR